MFRAYKITGLKLEYRPYEFSTGTFDSIIKAVTVGTVMDVVGAVAVPIPLSQFNSSLDTKEYSPGKPFKRFYHISRWSKGREINWRTTQEALANTYGTATPDCMTCLQVDSAGFGNGVAMG